MWLNIIKQLENVANYSIYLYLICGKKYTKGKNKKNLSALNNLQWSFSLEIANTSLPLH